MSELIYEHAVEVEGTDGRTYVPRTFGEMRSDRTWKGWIEFHPLDGGGPVLATRPGDLAVRTATPWPTGPPGWSPSTSRAPSPGRARWWRRIGTGSGLRPWARPRARTATAPAGPAAGGGPGGRGGRGSASSSPAGSRPRKQGQGLLHRRLRCRRGCPRRGRRRRRPASRGRGRRGAPRSPGGRPERDAMRAGQRLAAGERRAAGRRPGRQARGRLEDGRLRPQRPGRSAPAGRTRRPRRPGRSSAGWRSSPSRPAPCAWRRPRPASAAPGRAAPPPGASAGPPASPPATAAGGAPRSSTKISSMAWK